MFSRDSGFNMNLKLGPVKILNFGIMTELTVLMFVTESKIVI